MNRRFVHGTDREENLSCGKNKTKFPDLLFKLEFEERTFIFAF